MPLPGARFAWRCDVIGQTGRDDSCNPALGGVPVHLIQQGILVAVIAGLPLASDPAHWRSMFLYAAIPGALQLFLMTVVPESPGWLRRKGQVAKAEAAEIALWGEPSADIDSGDDKGEKDAPLSELFAPSNRKQITIGTALFFLQQMSESMR